MTGSDIRRRPPFGQHPLVGERGSDTYRRILAAALDMFDESGFNDATVESITEAAGCSRPAFYQYFSSKGDVFWALAGRLGTEMVALSERLGEVTPDAEGVATLERWTDDFLTLRSRYRPMFSAFQSASREDRELAAGARTFAHRMGAAVIRSSGARDDSPQATIIGSALVGVITQCGAIMDGLQGMPPRARLVRGLAMFIHRVISGPIPGVNLPEPVYDRITRSPGCVPSPPEPVLRPRGRLTRRRLLDAGAEVLPLRGYHEARVDDIVQVAGVSHGTFYRYFDSKDDLFRSLASEASAEMIGLLDRLCLAEGQEALNTWLHAWFAAYARNGGVLSTWEELQRAGRDVVEMSEVVATTTLDRLVRSLDDRPFGDALVDGMAFLALLERVPYSALTLGQMSEEEGVEAMVAMVRRGILGQE